MQMDRTTLAFATPDRLLMAAEVANMLSVPVSWVREHTRLGEIPHIRLGRYVRYRYEAVRAWLETQEREDAARGAGYLRKARGVAANA